MKKAKVFIISLHKTGTTSVAYFLEKLGYLVSGPDTHLFEKVINKDYVEVNDFLKKYDAFQDDPWYLTYKYVDTKYDNAKFIFLKRDTESWINSVQHFYGENRYNNKVRRLFYGHQNTLRYKEKYIKTYEKHNRLVREYYKEKKNYIEINVAVDYDSVRLQEFLNLKIKYTKFPLKNAYPKNQKEKRVKSFKNLVKGIFGLKYILKVALKNFLQNEDYLKLRTKTRYLRAKYRVFINNFFHQNI
jgi:hypothetical protein